MRKAVLTALSCLLLLCNLLCAVGIIAFAVICYLAMIPFLLMGARPFRRGRA